MTGQEKTLMAVECTTFGTGETFHFYNSLMNTHILSINVNWLLLIAAGVGLVALTLFLILRNKKGDDALPDDLGK